MKQELISRPPVPSDYGQHLFSIKVPKKLCADEVITVRADGYNIDGEESLTFYCQISEEEILNTISLPKNNWIYVYLSEEQGQHPACVERWNGVANVRIIEVEPTFEKEVQIEQEINNEIDIQSTETIQVESVPEIQPEPPTAA